jgi:hypothetical protein
LAFVTRLGYTEAELSQEQKDCWRRAWRGIRRYFPQLPVLITANQKRAFLKERGINRPANVALADLPIIALDRETIDNAFPGPIEKLLRPFNWAPLSVTAL